MTEHTSTAIRMNATDLKFAREIRGLADTELNTCLQCRSCSGGCPFSEHMDFKPNGVMRLIQLGMKAEALSCDTIWICVGCHTCSLQCPVGIDIAAVMDALRERALAEGAHVPEPDILDFHREVLGSIERYGRTHKLEIMLRYKLKTRDLFGDIQVGLKMLAKRKLDLSPSKVSRIDEVKKLFQE